MTRELAAALIRHHTEAHELLEAIATKVDDIDLEDANWGHVADLSRIVECLRNALGE